MCWVGIHIHGEVGIVYQVIRSCYESCFSALSFTDILTVLKNSGSFEYRSVRAIYVAKIQTYTLGSLNAVSATLSKKHQCAVYGGSKDDIKADDVSAVALKFGGA